MGECGWGGLITNSNTGRLFSQMLKSSDIDVFPDNCTDYSDISFCRVTSDFISMMLDGVTLFSGIKNLQNTCKCTYYSQSW